jgi:alkylation response protein AidB-like acyl-CoA dehydrogenase
MKKIVLSAEQQMLQEIASRFLRERYGFAQRAAICASAGGCDEQIWRLFAEMGWLALPFPAPLGGGEGSMFDLALLMEAFGAALVVEPFVPSVVGGGMALLAGASPSQLEALIPALCEGRLRLALAATEPASGYDVLFPATRAARAAEGYRLNGAKAVVLGAPQADLLLVSAQAVEHPPGALSLFLVPSNAAGLRLRSYATIDGRRAAEVILDDVRLGPEALLGAYGAGGPILERAIDACLVAFLAEAAGAVQAAFQLTADYLNTREQFGKKLAAFQALRHRIARIYVMQAEVRALCRQAAAAFSEAPGSDDAKEAIAAAKISVGQQGRQICEEAIQLHGAIAITDEYIAGHYLKRLVTIDHMFGNAHHHLNNFAATARSLAMPASPG